MFLQDCDDFSWLGGAKIDFVRFTDDVVKMFLYDLDDVTFDASDDARLRYDVSGGDCL